MLPPLWKAGERACRRAVEDLPDDPAPWLNLGLFRTEQGRSDDNLETIGNRIIQVLEIGGLEHALGSLNLCSIKPEQQVIDLGSGHRFSLSLTRVSSAILQPWTCRAKTSSPPPMLREMILRFLATFLAASPIPLLTFKLPKGDWLEPEFRVKIL